MQVWYSHSVLNDTGKTRRGEVRHLDKYKLEYEMKVRNVTQEELCKALDISRSAFYRKCNGLSEFTQGEIQRIVDFLQLDSPMGIFFKDKVS